MVRLSTCLRSPRLAFSSSGPLIAVGIWFEAMSCCVLPNKLVTFFTRRKMDDGWLITRSTIRFYCTSRPLSLLLPWLGQQMGGKMQIERTDGARNMLEERAHVCTGSLK